MHSYCIGMKLGSNNVNMSLRVIYVYVSIVKKTMPTLQSSWGEIFYNVYFAIQVVQKL